MVISTLCYLIGKSEVLLAMKRRGFGAGKFNGVGGKVMPSESVLDCIIREAKEEIGVEISPNDLVTRGKLLFSFQGKSDWNQTCHVFTADSWRNDPMETDEMKPEWFPIENLPFEKMWSADPYWLPQVLAGRSLEADILFEAETFEVISKKIKTKK